MWSWGAHLPERGFEILLAAGAGVDHLPRAIDDDDVRGGRHPERPGGHALVVVQRPEGGLPLRDVAAYAVTGLVDAHVHADEVDPAPVLRVGGPDGRHQLGAELAPGRPELEEDRLDADAPAEIDAVPVEIVHHDLRRAAAHADAVLVLGGRTTRERPD